MRSEHRYECVLLANIAGFLFLGYLSCFVDTMKLQYNETTMASSNVPGVDIKVPGWGTTTTFERLDSSRMAQFFLGDVSHYAGNFVESKYND